MNAKTLTKVGLVIVLTGCVSKPDNFDRNVFASAVDITVIKLANTKPIDFEKEKPLIYLRKVCQKYTVDPAKHREEMLDIAASADEAYWDFHFPGEPKQWQSVSRRNADLIYQDCRAEYLKARGATTAPLIKLKDPSEYKTDEWKE